MAKNFLFTPIGVAKWPHIAKPDNYKGEERYKVNLLLNPEDVPAFKKKLEEFAEANRGTITTKKPKLGSLKKEVDKEDNETGLYEISTKSRYKPIVKDSKNRKIEHEVRIGGGSKVRLCVEPIAYDGGVSLRLHQVQVIDLVEYGTGGGPDFDEVEGGYEEEPRSELDEGGFASEEPTEDVEEGALDI